MKKFIFILIFPLLWTTFSCQVKHKKLSPNLIIILADDLGYADVGFNGCKDIPTPNIDKIARYGVKFTNGYVTYCVCGPSRAGLLTGRYQDRFGFGRNPLFAPNDSLMGLSLEEETLADVIKRAGYQSIAIGKWHLGAHKSLHPLKRGFDEFYGFLSGGHRYFPEELTLEDVYEAKSQYDGYKTKLLRNYQRVDEKEYLTDAFSREACNFIERNHTKPFFIYLAYNAPHTPLQATDKYLSRFDTISNRKRKIYAAMVSAIDDGVGKIMNELDKNNIRKNTLVVFLSDNGGPVKHNGSRNDPLRGQKGQLFEGGIRVPFAMSWPSVIPPGIIYEKPVISFDIFATIIAQTKKSVDTKHPLDGVNLIPYVTGQDTSAPHTYLFWRKYDAGIFALRNDNNKMLLKARTHEKYLYNLKKDISESRNIAAAKTKTFDTLYKAFTDWSRTMKDPVFMGLLMDKKYSELHPDRFKKPFSPDR